MFIFLMCAISSLVVWFLFSLSNTYTYMIDRPIAFKGFSEKNPINFIHPEKFNIRIKGSGWNLISMRMGLQTDSLQLDMTGISLRDDHFLLSSHLKDLNVNLPEEVSLTGIFPDTIYFNRDVYSRKKVAVALDTNILFKKQFFYGKDIQINPDSVWVTGTPQAINSIDEIRTKKIQYKNIDRDIALTTDLVIPKIPVQISPQQVNVYIPVEQFTENTVTLPIKVNGNKLNLQVNTYPSLIKVTYLVPMSEYDSVKPDFFEASVNINQWVKQKISILPVSIDRVPDYVRITNISPSKVDFLVKK